MAATPQYGTMVLAGTRSKRIYNVDVYFSDVADALVRWDAGAGASATSPQSWTAPEPVLLLDFAIVTGTADTTKIQVLRNNQPTGDFLRYTMHLTSLANRAATRLGFNQGTEVRAIQKA